MTPIARILTFAFALSLFGADISFHQNSRAKPANEAGVAGNSGDELAQLIFFSVVEGCCRDGVANSTLDALFEPGKESDSPEIFVYACPICFPALAACGSTVNARSSSRRNESPTPSARA